MLSSLVAGWRLPKAPGSASFPAEVFVMAAHSDFPHFPPPWAEVFGEDRRGVFAEFTVEGVTFAWRWIMPGSFRMGCDPEDEHGYDVEKPQHRVVISRGFWMGETPVTQAQWRAITGKNPSRFEGDQRPVERVSWHQSVAFAEHLHERFTGLFATLPTEAQWEYACRAGTQAAFHDGSLCTEPAGKDPALEKLGWFDENSDHQTHAVKEREPNAWGLYDLHGNVWEWCRDAWKEDTYRRREDGVIDPEEKGKDEDVIRVVRGGSWFVQARFCRAAFRVRFDSGDRGSLIGLRLAAGQELESGAAEPPSRAERRSRAGGRSGEVNDD